MQRNILGNELYEPNEKVLFVDKEGNEKIGVIKQVWLDWKLDPIYNIRTNEGKWLFYIKYIIGLYDEKK